MDFDDIIEGIKERGLRWIASAIGALLFLLVVINLWRAGSSFFIYSWALSWATNTLGLSRYPATFVGVIMTSATTILLLPSAHWLLLWGERRKQVVYMLTAGWLLVTASAWAASGNVNFDENRKPLKYYAMTIEGPVYGYDASCDRKYGHECKLLTTEIVEALARSGGKSDDVRSAGKREDARSSSPRSPTTFPLTYGLGIKGELYSAGHQKCLEYVITELSQFRRVYQDRVFPPNLKLRYSAIGKGYALDDCPGFRDVEIRFRHTKAGSVLVIWDWHFDTQRVDHEEILASRKELTEEVDFTRGGVLEFWEGRDPSMVYPDNPKHFFDIPIPESQEQKP